MNERELIETTTEEVIADDVDRLVRENFQLRTAKKPKNQGLWLDELGRLRRADGQRFFLNGELSGK